MLNGLPETNEEREVWDMLTNLKALHDELVNNEPRVVIKDNKVTWPVFKTNITWDTEKPMAQFEAVTNYMNKRGIEGNEHHLIAVGRVGVRQYFENYFRSIRGTNYKSRTTFN